ncbi:hypothetical protein D5F01_LYC08474 [Larimichthys crocea]|uniref:Uncharacterized protein n=1 Tax=Larimichthys crocea TaxID=215358 RepID=A0A6G0IQ01_LARCR|nr:hypothetical protein D5F01_LYC08474 [Larimichthys crocea]
MEQSLADLLSGAFSETSVPLFPDGDLDFENLNFDEKLGEDKTGIARENLPTKEDESLNEEATVRSADMETEDIYMAENVDEEQSDGEDFQGAGVKSTDKTPEEEEEDYTSSGGESEEEGSASGEDEEDEEEDLGTGEESGELLMSVHCGGGFCDGTKEDRIFAEGQPLAPEGAESCQVKNEEQGDRERDEEVSYFERVPERGSVMMIKDDGIEEDEEKMKKKSERTHLTLSVRT